MTVLVGDEAWRGRIYIGPVANQRGGDTGGEMGEREDACVAEFS
jgi:hypothetical protein